MSKIIEGVDIYSEHQYNPEQPSCYLGSQMYPNFQDDRCQPYCVGHSVALYTGNDLTKYTCVNVNDLPPNAEYHYSRDKEGKTVENYAIVKGDSKQGFFQTIYPEPPATLHQEQSLLPKVKVTDPFNLKDAPQCDGSSLSGVVECVKEYGGYARLGLEYGAALYIAYEIKKFLS